MMEEAEQVIGREAETATFLSRCLANLNLRVAVSAHVNSVVRQLPCFHRSPSFEVDIF